MKSFIFFIHNLSNGNILVGDYLIEVWNEWQQCYKEWAKSLGNALLQSICTTCEEVYVIWKWIWISCKCVLQSSGQPLKILFKRAGDMV
jgi:hypothetical protein